MRSLAEIRALPEWVENLTRRTRLVPNPDPLTKWDALKHRATKQQIQCAKLLLEYQQALEEIASIADDYPDYGTDDIPRTSPMVTILDLAMSALYDEHES